MSSWAKCHVRSLKTDELVNADKVFGQYEELMADNGDNLRRDGLVSSSQECWCTIE